MTGPRVEGNVDTSALRDDQCMAQWRRGVPCPNAYQFVLETMHAPGFMKCCQVHHDGYLAAFGTRDVTDWTRDAWEAAGREAEIEATIAARASA